MYRGLPPQIGPGLVANEAARGDVSCLDRTPWWLTAAGLPRGISISAKVAPSRRRDSDRLARAIGAGEQPTGQVRMPLVPGGAGPEQFLADMGRVEHPLEAPPPLPDRLREAMRVICASSEEQIKVTRENTMQSIRRAAADLEGHRRTVVSRLHPGVRRVIGHIHLPLLEALLQTIDYKEDSEYISSLIRGRPMLGTGLLTTGLYPPQPSRASLTLQRWAQHPRERNLGIIRSVRASHDPELDANVWEKVKKEVERG